MFQLKKKKNTRGMRGGNMGKKGRTFFNRKEWSARMSLPDTRIKTRDKKEEGEKDETLEEREIREARELLDANTATVDSDLGDD